MSLIELERKTEVQKQLRTIAKLKKELKNVNSQTQKVGDDNANVTKFLSNTHILLSEADVQEADMKGQIEEIKRANAELRIEELEAQLNNVKAINEAEEYLETLERHYQDLDTKNESQKEQITAINQELTAVFEEIGGLEQ